MADGHDGAEHAFAGSLLPWYVNDSLDAPERERVRRHLEECGACRDDLLLLQRVRLAVRRSEAIPILPPHRPERLLQAIDRRESRNLRLRRAGFAAGAAALVALVFAAGIVVSGIVASGIGDDPPGRFRTLTSDPRAIAMDYVFELRFEAGLAAADRERVLGALQATRVEPGTPEGAYRVMLRLPAASLSELEAFTSRIEAMPEVRSARVVAMQLPVQQ